MYGAWRSGSAWTERVPRRDMKDKRGRSASICVLIGVRGRGGGTPLRLDWMWPPWDSVLKRSPTALGGYCSGGASREASSCGGKGLCLFASVRSVIEYTALKVREGNPQLDHDCSYLPPAPAAAISSATLDGERETTDAESDGQGQTRRSHTCWPRSA